MKVIKDQLVFSTGKELYVNRGIVGLSLTEFEDDRESLFHGYDGGCSLPSDKWDENRLIAVECVELADEMLKRWQEFRAKYANQQQSCTKIADC